MTSHRRSRRRLRTAGQALLAAAVVLVAAGARAGDVPPYGQGRELGRLANPRIDESSGVACSRRSEGLFWTHNDSGDGPILYCFDRQGADRGSVRLRNARAVDWEDLAAFEQAGQPWLLAADTGDNKRRRPELVLYLLREPPGGQTLSRREIGGGYRIAFRYPDGAHDCEAVGVDAGGGGIYLVTKETARPAGVYVLPLGDPGRRRLTARKVAALNIPMVTAMDISPDGSRAIVATYTDAWVFQRQAHESWPTAFARGGRQVSLPPRPWGESVCFGLDGATLYLTNERRPSPFLEVVPAAGNATGKQPDGAD